MSASWRLFQYAERQDDAGRAAPRTGFTRWFAPTRICRARRKIHLSSQFNAGASAASLAQNIFLADYQK
jgi:hypothetical protein